MFDQIAIRLIRGDFVCEATGAQQFRWLTEDANRLEVDAFLSKIGRRLAQTPNNHAFYAAWQKIGPDERQEVRRIFKDVTRIRPVINFLKFCMDTWRSEAAPVPNDRLDYAATLTAVTENPHLMEHLRDFSNLGKEFIASEASPKGMLEKVFQYMERTGYIAVLNRDQEAYIFTGKLDYFYQVMDFLVEHEKTIAEDTVQPDQQSGRLV